VLPVPMYKTLPRRPNDAVLHPSLGIKRVVAVTPGNRVVIDCYYTSNSIEPFPEEWPKVGVYIKQSILAQVFLLKNEYEFIPDDPVDKLPSHIKNTKDWNKDDYQ